MSEKCKVCNGMGLARRGNVFHDCPACECTGIEPVSKVDEALKEMNEALNKMNAKMLLDSMTEKPPSDERLFKPLTIIDDNPDNPRVEYSQIEHLLTGKVYFHGSEWKPQSPYPPWSCPRCSRIYGPSVQICVPCNTAVAAKEAK